jgi:hypothetical protein
MAALGPSFFVRPDCVPVVLLALIELDKFAGSCFLIKGPLFSPNTKRKLKHKNTNSVAVLQFYLESIIIESKTLLFRPILIEK